jgi:hypothetical protein
MDRKAAILFLGVISSFLAAASLFTSKLLGSDFFNNPEIIAISTGVLAVLTAGIAAVSMRQLLRSRELQHAAPRVFIIYAKEDLEKAREISSLLREHGLDTWLDVDRVQAGQIWKKAVVEGLENSAMAIVLSSENLSKSSFAMEELNRALGRLESKDSTISPVIPVKIDHSDIPKLLSHIQYVDMEDKDASDYLIKSVEGAMRRIAGPSARLPQTIS